MLIISHGVLVNFSKYFVMLHTFRKVVFWIFFFFFFSFLLDLCALKCCPYFKELNLFMGHQQDFLCFLIIINPLVLKRSYIEMRAPHYKKKKKKKKMNLREYSIRTIIEDICNNILFSVKCFSSGYCPLFPIRQFVFEL